MKTLKYRITSMVMVLLAAVLLSFAAMPMHAFASANRPVNIDIPIKYAVNGNAGTAGGDTFTLAPDDPGSPMPDGSFGGSKTVTIDDEGDYSFGCIHFDRPEVCWYTITRNIEEQAGVKKDDSVYRAKVIALNDGRGYVLVYKKGSDEKQELVYTDQVAPATGDTNEMHIFMFLLLASAASLAVIAAVRGGHRKTKDMGGNYE